NYPSVVSKAASVPVGSRNSSAFIHAGRSIPAASKNCSASIHAGRSILLVEIDQHLFMLGRWGSAVKSSAGCSWRNNRPYMQWRSKNNGGSH
nr:hypothetical protein [Tanacetum cinerariifolium]